MFKGWGWQDYPRELDNFEKLGSNTCISAYYTEPKLKIHVRVFCTGLKFKLTDYMYI